MEVSKIKSLRSHPGPLDVELFVVLLRGVQGVPELESSVMGPSHQKNT